MPELPKLVRLLIAPPLDDDSPQLILELDNGVRCVCTATFEQMEDMCDLLDGVLDSITEPAEEKPIVIPSTL